MAQAAKKRCARKHSFIFAFQCKEMAIRMTVFTQEHNSPTGVLTEGDDLDGLFLPDEPVSDVCLSSTALLSDCTGKIQPIYYDQVISNEVKLQHGKPEAKSVYLWVFG